MSETAVDEAERSVVERDGEGDQESALRQALCGGC